jgi:outer membrane protein assembly factor BamB
VRWRFVTFGVILVAGVLPACGGAPTHTTTTPPVTKPAPTPQDQSLPWPTYGADNARTRAVTARGLRPPFRRVWTYFGHHLLELPPVAGYGLLYEESWDGRIHAIDLKTGAVKWSYYSRRCGWASPALGNGLVFATFIGGVTARCSKLGDGSIVALSARTGRVRWSRNIGQSESSPLLSHGTVYFGGTDGRVYAFSAATGEERWSYDTGGPVKGSPALESGRLFVGNYGGSFYALDPRTGKLIWRSGGHGNFYAGPSVVDGRVYVGSIDGHVYAFSARNATELWNFGTGGYVYASPAVWRGIVLCGSYDHTFYAINGATGTLRWDFRANGAISGAASVIDGIVYFSTLAHKTYALDAASGRRVEEWADGDYSPAVAADGRLYLVGLGRIYALAPR